MLTLINPRVIQDRHQKWKGEYLCKCGNKTLVIQSAVNQGKTRSCGCMRLAKPTKLSKQSRLTIHRKRTSCYKGYYLNEYMCNCGNIVECRPNHVVTGEVLSCGCLRNERVQSAVMKHGMSQTRLHRIWKNMRKRCNNKNEPSFKNYGGRGISICKKWSSFSLFHKWAVSNGYKENLTLERKNVNSGYKPSNCKWIPLNEQSYNTTKSYGWELVNKMRNDFEVSQLTVSKICKKYNKKLSTVSRIVHYTSYKKTNNEITS